jgi:uncharacterized membrane protein
MGIDIKIPIGLMFGLLGMILTIYGLFTHTDASIYSRSLGININLFSGLLMLFFGFLMLFFARYTRKPK